jgi:hypothetical protein
MVAPPSFDNRSADLTGLPRAGALRESSARQVEARPNEPTATNPPRPTSTPSGDANAPVRGDRPTAQTLSSPFVAQFIAQQLNPQTERTRDRVETTRAFDAIRQALAIAERSRGPK